MFSLLPFIPIAIHFTLTYQQDAPTHEQCRFAQMFSQDDLMGDNMHPNATYFVDNVFYWEGQFHRDGVGYHQSSGLTIDHVILGYATGLSSGAEFMYSTPKNEAYHIMLLTHALAGNAQAAAFIYPANPTEAAALAFGILTKKLSTYNQFNTSYPGYGGFLPDFEMTNVSIWPGIVSPYKVSASDNGPLVWAIYSLIQALSTSEIVEYQELSIQWAVYFLYLRNNAKTVFFHGPKLGSICAVSILENPELDYTSQSFSCEDDNRLLNDPYEGELMAWFLYFSNNLNATEGEAIWQEKRPQLQAVNYTGSVVDTSSTQGGLVNFTGKPITGRHLMPITTQKGRYFGAQEHLKLLFLPYLDVPIVQRVMQNAEQIRTCNSDLMDQTPGLFASVMNATVPSVTAGGTYLSSVGIPSVALNQTQEQDVITPYAAFATILFDRLVGLSWYHNVLNAPCMQSVYGSTDSIRRDGSFVSRTVTWETKAPILLALLGGITNFVRDGFRRDGVLAQFLNVTNYEYGIVFDESMDGGMTLMGEDIPFCLPTAKVSTLSLTDYSSCRYDPAVISKEV